jgi:hypothetical protein
MIAQIIELLQEAKSLDRDILIGQGLYEYPESLKEVLSKSYKIAKND